MPHWFPLAIIILTLFSWYVVYQMSWDLDVLDLSPGDQAGFMAQWEDER